LTENKSNSKHIKPSQTEKILRKTVIHEIIERPFTTGRKRKTTIRIDHSTVIEKCRQLTEMALRLFPDRKISHEDLTFLIMKHIGGNRGSVRAYLGYRGRILRSSYGNTKIIGSPRKGYLEIYGYMHPKGLKWIIHAQTTFPQVLKSLSNPPIPPFTHDNECVDKFSPIKKIYLTHSSQSSSSLVERGNGGKPGPLTSGCPPSSSREVEKKEEEDTVREIFSLWKTDTKLYTETNEYLKLLKNAPQLDSEPDRGKVDWGKQEPIIPKKETLRTVKD